MGRAVDVFEVLIRAGPGIGVAHQHGNGRSQRLAFEDAREDLHLVGLVPQCGEPALSWSPSVEIVLDHLLVQRKPGRTAVHHRADAATVGFPERRYPEQLPGRTAHCISTLQT